jgi:hypothetical protein
MIEVGKDDHTALPGGLKQPRLKRRSP